MNICRSSEIAPAWATTAITCLKVALPPSIALKTPSRMPAMSAVDQRATSRAMPPSVSTRIAGSIRSICACCSSVTVRPRRLHRCGSAGRASPPGRPGCSGTRTAPPRLSSVMTSERAEPLRVRDDAPERVGRGDDDADEAGEEALRRRRGLGRGDGVSHGGGLSGASGPHRRGAASCGATDIYATLRDECSVQLERASRQE